MIADRSMSKLLNIKDNRSPVVYCELDPRHDESKKEALNSNGSFDKVATQG